MAELVVAVKSMVKTASCGRPFTNHDGGCKPYNNHQPHDRRWSRHTSQAHRPGASRPGGGQKTLSDARAMATLAGRGGGRPAGGRRPPWR